MATISKEALQELHDAVASWQERAQAAYVVQQTLEARVRSFDSILDDIIRVGGGMFVNRQPGLNDYNSFGSGGSLMETSRCGHVKKLTREERQEFEIRQLHSRITDLEARIAAALAVASFARTRHGRE